MIDIRRSQPPYAARRVHCVASETLERIEYVVRDEGDGFDHARPTARAPEAIPGETGRGIMLMFTFMDEVRYNRKGNQVTLTKINPAAEERAH
jgi:anti-sigma regulatory factor (Ser/Thr protein kinase)